MTKEIFEGLKYVAISCLLDELNDCTNDYRFDVLSVMNVLNNFLDYDMYDKYLLCLDDVRDSIGVMKNMDRIKNKVIFSLNEVQIDNVKSKNEMIFILDKFLNPSMYLSYVDAIDNFSYTKGLTR